MIVGRLVMLMWLMLIGGPIMTVVGCQTRQKLAALEETGITTEGVIISGHERRGRRGRRSYYFDIAFKIENGEAVVEEFAVKGSFYDGHVTAGDESGDSTVEVVYNPDDPDEAIIVGGSMDSPLTMFIGIGVTVIGLLGVAGSFFINID